MQGSSIHLPRGAARHGPVRSDRACCGQSPDRATATQANV